MNEVHDVRPLALHDLEDLGPPMAYVKVIDEEDSQERVYGLYEADGQLVGIAPTRALAFAAARQYALEAVDAH